MYQFETTFRYCFQRPAIPVILSSRNICFAENHYDTRPCKRKPDASAGWSSRGSISVAMMCCPPLLGFQKPIFDREAFICMLDWGNMAAYTITLSILVLGPSVITIVYTYSYIFTMMRRLRSGVLIHDKEYATALSENLSNPSHIMSFILVMAFWVSWAPYAVLRIYALVNGPPQVNCYFC